MPSEITKREPSTTHGVGLASLYPMSDVAQLTQTLRQQLDQFQVLRRSPTISLGTITRLLAKQNTPLTAKQLLLWTRADRDQLEAKLGFSPKCVAGTTYDDVNAGLKKYRLRDDTGRVSEITVPLLDDEPQTLPQLIAPEHICEPTGIASVGLVPASSRVCDSSLPLPNRVEALQDWIVSDNDAAAQFIITELASVESSSDWLNTLIYAAESVRFRDRETRCRVVEVLLKQAGELRRSTDRGVAEVVWSAIHRVGSIIPIERANELVEFLGPSSSVDTRLAALQSVVRIFEVAPPNQPADFLELANQAALLAESLWNPIVFTVGEISAIAIEATVAAGALADERVLKLVTLAAGVGRPWVMNKLKKRFDELLALRQRLRDDSPHRRLVQEASALANTHSENLR